MRTRYILGIMMSAAFLFTGCMKEDIDELRKQQADNAARIAALEVWQTTVNSNITSLQQLVTALENNDYVTGVVPFDTPVPGGYRITFTKSPEATIWNGAKGDQGQQGETGAAGATGHAPALGVAEFPASSGVYYWTLDDRFITDDGTPTGNKMPVRGEKGDGGDPGTPGIDGKTPKVAIGSDGYWYISADGTATGTPQAGTGWTNTNVKATGDTGPTGLQGPQGDAIFAAGGVDNSNADYVVFTLANNGGTITVPKYKAIGINIVQPGLFTPGVAKDMTYQNAGTVVATNIRVVDVPAGWKVVADVANTKFVITPPATFTAENFEGEATVLVGVGNEVSAMYTLKMRGAGFYRVGDYYPDPCVVYENGALVSGAAAVGVVFWVDPSDSRHGKVVGLQGANDVTWSDAYNTTGATDTTNGLANMATIYALADDFAGYPAFAWVHGLNPANTDYSDDGATGVWYLPVRVELQHLYCAWNGQSPQTWGDYTSAPFPRDTAARVALNGKLTAAGGTGLSVYYYWSSSEYDSSLAWYVLFDDGNTYNTHKPNGGHSARCVLAF